MGRTRYLWERREDSKMEIAALEAQRRELEIQRAQGADERLKLRNQIRELTEEREGLVQQLKNAQASPPSTSHGSPETAFRGPSSVNAQVRQLRKECEQLNKEREAFRKQVLELQAVNIELNMDLEQASLAIDMCLPCVRAPPGAPVTLDKSMLALVTSVGKRSVRHPQLSDPPPLTLPWGSLPSALDTPTSQLTPTLATPIRGPSFRLPSQSFTSFPRPTLPASASLAAPPSQESDWEAEMDPVPPEGPESQQ